MSQSRENNEPLLPSRKIQQIYDTFNVSEYNSKEWAMIWAIFQYLDENRTPPPASMKWPEPCHVIEQSYYRTDRERDLFYMGFNEAIRKGKELNAPKGESLVANQFEKNLTAIRESYEPSEKKESDIDVYVLCRRGNYYGLFFTYEFAEKVSHLKQEEDSNVNYKHVKGVIHKMKLSEALKFVNCGWSKKEGKDG